MGRFPTVQTSVSLILALILGIGLVGCGGGGGGSSRSADLSAVKITTGSRSIQLNNYNNWIAPKRWGDRAEYDRQVEFLVQTDRICMTEAYAYALGLTPAELRARNPKAKVFALYDLYCKNKWDSDWEGDNSASVLQTPLTLEEIEQNNWWLRDGNGSIVQENDYTWFLDVGKPGYKEAFLRNLLQRIEGKGYDGVLFDYNLPCTITRWILDREDGLALTAPAAYPDDDAWFENAWKPFYSYVMGGLHAAGYEVIGNCAGPYDPYAYRGLPEIGLDWQRTQVDGTVYESWAIWWDGTWLDGSTVEARINSLASDPLEVWTGDYAIRTTDPEYQQKANVALAMFYIGLPQSPALQAKRFYHHFKDRTLFWEPSWNVYIGTPAETPVKRQGEYFWSRKFTNGIVLLNYGSSETLRYTLDRPYCDAEGGVRSGEIAVPEHTGLVLTLDGT